MTLPWVRAAWTFVARGARRAPALDGDRAAYERLLGEIADMLRRLVRAWLSRLGLGPDEAEDVVQEVLLALHRKRDSWDRDRPLLPGLHGRRRWRA